MGKLDKTENIKLRIYDLGTRVFTPTFLRDWNLNAEILDALGKMVYDNADDIELLQGKVDALNPENITALENKVENNARAIELLTTDLDKVKRNVATIATEQEKDKEAISHLNDKCLEYGNELEELKRNFSILNEDCKEVKEILTNVKDDIETLKSEDRTITSQLNSLQTLYTALDDRVSALENN